MQIQIDQSRYNTIQSVIRQNIERHGITLQTVNTPTVTLPSGELIYVKTKLIPDWYVDQNEIEIGEAIATEIAGYTQQKP